ncbi:MAG: hypothetical protein Q4C74_06790 [Rothia sp. (in: high G+C Gram-positive bacteria)]|nr:hypothetical protein [Rothia sp. (in: high G+C Gram-positive bacteria)]
MADCTIPLETLSDWLEEDHSQAGSAAQQQLSEHIDSCPICTQRVVALRKLEQATAELEQADLEEQQAQSGWLDKILSNIVLETKAGRSIPISSDESTDWLAQTEGSVLAAIRQAADQLGHILIGRCRLLGDIEQAGAPVQIDVTASVECGVVIAQATARLRQLILAEVARVSELNLTAVNITVEDIYELV